ncbi:MAG: hypothetical protein M1818_007494 [Claussenomyces sp. TS43310]|nr:MAG: hypothetical protein M1818_007494 [Claussenomyces sp. TS43310]
MNLEDTRNSANHSSMQSINVENYAVTPTFAGSRACKRLGQPADRMKSLEKSLKTLVVSPYVEDKHLLYLDTVDTQCQLLARALTVMKALRADYATAPYLDTFNWAEVFAILQQLIQTSEIKWKERKFYVVIFRSQIPPTTKYSDLGTLDIAAHAEATKSGGFLKYWFGTPDHLGQNLATCIWRSKEDARLGGVGPAHREAAMSARHLYSNWNIERLALVIGEEAKNWEFQPWSD